jgi:hypothetical protein
MQLHVALKIGIKLQNKSEHERPINVMSIIGSRSRVGIGILGLFHEHCVCEMMHHLLQYLRG